MIRPSSGSSKIIHVAIARGVGPVIALQQGPSLGDRITAVGRCLIRSAPVRHPHDLERKRAYPTGDALIPKPLLTLPHPNELRE